MFDVRKTLCQAQLTVQRGSKPLSLVARFFRVKGSPHSPEPGGDSPEPGSAPNEQNEADQGLTLMTFPQMTSSQTVLPLARDESRVDRPSLNEARYYASQRAFEREQVRKVARCLVARCLIAPRRQPHQHFNGERTTLRSKNSPQCRPLAARTLPPNALARTRGALLTRLVRGNRRPNSVFYARCVPNRSF